MRVSIHTAMFICGVVTAGCTGTHWNTSQTTPSRAYVPDSATAIRIAEAVWIPIYGEKQVRSERPFQAVLRGDIWHVYGTLPEPPDARSMTIGGTVEAEIDRRSGRILRVDHGE